MGWVPEGKRGVSGEQKPAPRRRRRVGAPDLLDEQGIRGGHGHRRRRAAADEAVAMMGDRDERIVDDRPAGGNRDRSIDKRPRVTVSLGKRWSQIVTEIRAGSYTWQQFAEGLTAEELARAQLKDTNGGFSGRPPAIVPREFHLACFRELKRRFDEEFQGGVLAIAKEYVQLAQDPALPAKDRARMMQYAMERVFGGIPKEVLVKQDSPWEAVFTTIVDDEGDTPATWRKNRYTQHDEDEGSEDD